MPRPVHFELTTTDPDRATAFYRETLGWKVVARDPSGATGAYWTIATGPSDSPGIDGGMRRRMSGEPPGVTNTMAVASVDVTLEQIVANGGAVVVPPFVVPGICRIAYAADPDGNVFAIVEPDPASR